MLEAHDSLLVGLSLTIAVLASYTALTIAGRLRTADRRGNEHALALRSAEAQLPGIAA